MLFEFVLDVSKCEFGAPDGNIQFGKNKRQCSDMVFVPVGEDNAFHALAIFGEIRNIGDNNIHAQELCFREH